jgi:EAL domain-containing protein (putative c-di-GMP-specific phosphodiesterase class I)
MKEPGFVGMVEQIMADAGCDPSQLVIEVTESLLMEKPEMFQTMYDLRSLGLALSLDDFGTGYSSLSRLHLLPLQHLKIDRSFISGIHDQPACRSIVSMIIRMGQEMGLIVVAEGVETTQQQDALIALGCHEAQGYLYARPLPPERIEGFLRAAR